jgi:hypothetical protein
MKSLIVYLKNKPVVGMITSLFASLLDYKDTFQLMGIILGLLIAVITLMLKVIELIEKLKKKPQ